MGENSLRITPDEPDQVCRRCNILKSASAFHRGGKKQQRMTICSACRSETRPPRPSNLRAKPHDPEAQRRRRFPQLYGITVEQYEMMLITQGGVCAVCENAPRGVRPLVIDHCHESGRVRALLCDPCNTMLGSYEILRGKAEAYLAKYGQGNPLLESE